MQRARLNPRTDYRVRIATFADGVSRRYCLPLALAAPASAATLDRVRRDRQDYARLS